MVWIVDETISRPLLRFRMIHLVLAELRQFWWLSPAVLVAGLFVLALLAGVTDRVPTDAKAEGVIFNNLASLLLSLCPVLLAGPVVAGAGSKSMVVFWFRLPIERTTVNQVRILALVLHCWPAVLTWPLIVALLDRVYGPVSFWVFVNSGLVAGIGLLLSTRTSLAPFLVYFFIPLVAAFVYFVPGTEQAGRSLLLACGSFLVAAGLLAVAMVLAVLALKSGPPRRR